MKSILNTLEQLEKLEINYPEMMKCFLNAYNKEITVDYSSPVLFENINFKENVIKTRLITITMYFCKRNKNKSFVVFVEINDKNCEDENLIKIISHIHNVMLVIMGINKTIREEPWDSFLSHSVKVGLLGRASIMEIIDTSIIGKHGYNFPVATNCFQIVKKLLQCFCEKKEVVLFKVSGYQFACKLHKSELFIQISNCNYYRYGKNKDFYIKSSHLIMNNIIDNVFENTGNLGIQYMLNSETDRSYTARYRIPADNLEKHFLNYLKNKDNDQLLLAIFPQVNFEFKFKVSV